MLEAQKRSLQKVLVTCDKSNTASAKIIERNGGVFENEVWWEPSKDFKKRYWIALKEALPLIGEGLGR